LHIDPRERPAVLVSDEERPGSRDEPRRIVADTDWLAHVSERAGVEPNNRAPFVVREPDLSAGYDDPDREPADVCASYFACARIDPQHLSRVGARRPQIATGRGQSEHAASREGKRIRRLIERSGVDPQQRSRSCLERPQLAVAEDGWSTGRSNQCRTSTVPLRQSRTASWPAPERCWTDAIR